MQKSVGDMIDLGYNNQTESAENGTMPKLNMMKWKYIHFVKSNLVYKPNEPNQSV